MRAARAPATSTGRPVLSQTISRLLTARQARSSRTVASPSQPWRRWRLRRLPAIRKRRPHRPAIATPQIAYRHSWRRRCPGGAAGAVRYDIAQSLTDPQKVQARGNIYAAPFDALAYNGMQVNGNTEVDQIGIGAGVALTSGTETYVKDMWSAYFSRAATLAVNAITAVGPNGGYQSSVDLTAATGLTTLGANDVIILRTPIEGYRSSRLGFGVASPQSVSIGAWVLATISGTVTVSLQNGAQNRTYPINVAIASGWNWITATFPGDSAGTWLYTNGVGLRVCFCFGAGSSQQGTANSWNANGLFGTSATTNFMATTGNQVAVTGLIVLPGIELPASARSALIARPFTNELLLCQRYWWKSYSYASPPGTNGDNQYFGMVSTGGTQLFGNLTFPDRVACSSDCFNVEFCRYSEQMVELSRG